jgi:molybdenum cofactor cytidylyltransferase
MGDVGFILLAAGASTRLGAPKQLLLYGGRTLIRRAAESALQSLCTPIVVVLGSDAKRIAIELAGMPVTVVENEDWNLGMGGSLRAGLAEAERLTPDLDAVVIAVCDQPLLTSATLDLLVTTFRSTGSPVVASHYAGVDGVPALFARSLFPDLHALDPAEGARGIIRRHGRDVVSVEFPGGELDIDTVVDVERLNAET